MYQIHVKRLFPTYHNWKKLWRVTELIRSVERQQKRCVGKAICAQFFFTKQCALQLLFAASVELLKCNLKIWWLNKHLKHSAGSCKDEM